MGGANMETRVKEIAERIKGLREIMEFTPEEVAQAVGVSTEEMCIRDRPWSMPPPPGAKGKKIVLRP